MDRLQGEPSLYDIQFALRTDYDAPGQHSYHVDPLETHQVWGSPGPDLAPNGWDPDEELAQMLSTVTSADTAPAPLDAQHRHRSDRRRPRPGSHIFDSGQRVSPATILIATIAACAVAMLGWSIAYSYNQLRAIASTVLPAPLAQWWPLTVYGPWLVAALSILRASFQHRTARRSWTVILVASATAVALCISHSSHSLLSMVIVGIPPITALVCFRELVGQVSYKYRPRHAAPGKDQPGGN
ncbi:DUF2637 domain-containing protein [Streptomyces yaanensis]|uniref:DUF2637 domain-containing protein n=1 Tax=Streptomyces yaanensis TaxID=1142239 RepID=A0ABV7SHV4_9ACTN|nr:DUF2637 domain-containing protein [Streptomyces sp. CGMCC 4.7035]WNB97446.1 DUF2637 domain-containing protein [Streptomyces sp. CGMCC 4.7035]